MEGLWVCLHADAPAITPNQVRVALEMAGETDPDNEGLLLLAHREVGSDCRDVARLASDVARLASLGGQIIE